MNTHQRARLNRTYKGQERGSRTSPKTEAEDAVICLAWEAGELTEGQAVAALGEDLIGARTKRDALIGKGVILAARLKEGRKPEAQEAEG